MQEEQEEEQEEQEQEVHVFRFINTRAVHFGSAPNQA